MDEAKFIEQCRQIGRGALAMAQEATKEARVSRGDLLVECLKIAAKQAEIIEVLNWSMYRSGLEKLGCEPPTAEGFASRPSGEGSLD